MAEQNPPPAPTPDPGAAPWKTAYLVGKQKMGSGELKVMFIILRDDTLQVATFMKPEQAETLAQQLLNTAAEVRTGLVIPPNVSLT